jgi:hypothetical protein
MSQKIKLDSVNHKTQVEAIAQDSILSCDATSAPDVYVTAVLKDEQHSLSAGDSMAVPKGTVTMRVFRKSAASEPFSADLTMS